ncbi:BamA/TamA family outer membrane protein [Ferrimonas marina]|uniref:Surface antigen n=1 Tax=Ferrimonas marina TaxID=299255 RepID=A0A1M5ZEH9_9GAMM|nr:BamA/TamA family outer membrane protein [Ferrimonas marina]SHI22640.1 Surface antigen [Ferrimonas marina]
MRRFIHSVLLMALSCGTALAQEDLEVAEPQAGRTRNAAVPIAFSTSSMGLSVGAAASLQGIGQPQAQVVAIGAYSENQSYVTYLAGYNYQLVSGSRFFFDIEGFVGRFKESTLHLDGDMPFSPPAGSHDSAFEDAVVGLQNQWDVRGTVRYLLPLGAGREPTPRRPELREGLPVPKAERQQQRQGAYTALELSPFYEKRYVGPLDRTELSQGLTLTLEHDARNFLPSPTDGYRFSLEVDRDWGSEDRVAYTRWQAQYRHYFDLGQSDWSKQQSVALTAYLSDVPTWEGGSEGDLAAPPWFAQSTLGGWYRLRGYSSARYHDRSAIYYGAEYRTVPTWQPQGGIPFINRYRFPWYEVALFGGVGRVNHEFDLPELHRDLQWSAGVGLRLWVENVLVRLDLAFAQDDSGLVVAVNQPF